MFPIDRGRVLGFAARVLGRGADKPVAATAVAADVRVANAASLKGRLSPAEKVAFDKLGPKDQAALAGAWSAVGAEGQGRLRALLAAGVLGTTDATGATLAANLGKLAAVKVPEGAPFRAAGLVEQVLAHMADPDVIEQDDRNTCGATTVQYMLLLEQPAEYVRLVTGLAGGGEVKLRGGETLRRVSDSLGPDDTERDDVERLMQSAIQDFGFDLRGGYANTTDDFRHGPREGKSLWGRFKRAVASPVNWAMGHFGVDKGIAEGKVHHAYEQILGRQAKLVGDLPGGQFLKPRFMREDVYAEVAEAVKRGPVPVDIALEKLGDKPWDPKPHVLDREKLSYYDEMKSHQVLVLAIEKGTVTYRNPWGYTTRVSEAEFKSRLTDAFIPDYEKQPYHAVLHDPPRLP